MIHTVPRVDERTVEVQYREAGEWGRVFVQQRNYHKGVGGSHEEREGREHLPEHLEVLPLGEFVLSYEQSQEFGVA